ncbi:ATP-dependent DNA helicase DinG [Abditibacterium utsteinense]|uniref:DNA 5'-3' helicase n=1 Tax=Abditibacterium utsteinense TaxID=1960156 RepID=A0A2S8SWH1_9BACT|nr:ATP-dependent DNA helicase [Abditibacterium utsteinense]PQV65148.1 ATP-dependent DNA helicase DinG [Abditibacterium utsteinense]
MKVPAVSPVVSSAPNLSIAERTRLHVKELDDAQLARIFGDNGFLAKTMAAQNRPFEARPEQLEMAQSIAGAIRDKTHLLVEAGTGTGKSYAYLVPLLLWAIENKKRVLIATGTKALQQQLVERDLPFLRDLFKRNFNQDIKFSLCLGTGNYICPRRLAKAQVAGLFASESEVKQLDEIQKFAAKSPTGRNLDLPFEPMPGLWSQLNRESDLCMNRNCSLYDSSFYWKARREQEKAHILVANHHLLFAHIAAGGNKGNQGGVLPAFDALVIDEAHGAEDVAASYLGIEFSNLGAAKLIELLANRRSNKTVLSASKIPHRAELEARLHDAAAEAREAVSRFFENLQLAVRFEPNRTNNVRITRKNLLSNELDEPLQKMESVLKDARREAEGAQDETLLKEIEGFLNRCAEMRKASEEILSQSRAGYVYWASSVPRTGDGFGKAPRVPRLSLHGAPIEVAQAMRESVFEAFSPVILTSATMTTGGSFEFLLERLGLKAPILEASETPPFVPFVAAPRNAFDGRAPQKMKHSYPAPVPQKMKESASENSTETATEEPEKEPLEVRTLTLGSPFDYRKNALIYVAQDLPDPTTNVTFWEEAAVKRAAEVVKRTDGRAFILCTSFRMVDQTARFLEKVMPARIRILKQGGMARGQLLSEFRSDISSVLVGTTSFWQGVDVPGESLSCVIIMKLPFAVPDDPIVQARVETIKKRGKDAFNEYQVPQAVMMFRQGFGRLIRTQEDRGVVAILDPRVKSKPYGKVFLSSLPEAEVTGELERLSLFVSGI